MFGANKKSARLGLDEDGNVRSLSTLSFPTSAARQHCPPFSPRNRAAEPRLRQTPATSKDRVTSLRTAAVSAPDAAALPFQIRLDVVFNGWRSRARMNKPVRDEIKLRRQVLDCLVKPFSERTASDVVSASAVRSELRPPPSFSGLPFAHLPCACFSPGDALSCMKSSVFGQATFMSFISRATALTDLKKEVCSPLYCSSFQAVQLPVGERVAAQRT